MPKLVVKVSYAENKNSAGYMEYIATREGVELLDEDIYMRYMANRPKSHGLFSSGESVNLDKAIEDLNLHEGPVWTYILSLHREDATRLGYDNAANWKQLLVAQQNELARAMNIPLDKLQWYAAFHDEGNHPHVHMMVWANDSKTSFLTKQGLETIRSKLTNAIFKDEMTSIYVQKDLRYKEVTATAQKNMRELLSQMQTCTCESPEIEKLMLDLAAELKDTKGKKQYGYLKKPVKELVDKIVDELEKQPEVKAFYDEWNKLRDEVESYYKQSTREHLPLSQQKEFRAIKNMVIHEADSIRLGEFTFEDEGMVDEPEDAQAVNKEYIAAKAILYDYAPEEEKQNALSTLEQLYNNGYSVAAYLLGKAWRDGLGVAPNEEKAEHWFRLSAEAGNNYSQYALGKLLIGENRIAESVYWLEKAATQDNMYAQYTLGKLYLLGKDVPQDKEAAKEWLSRSAAQGNEYAQFYLDRIDQFNESSVLLSATRLLRHMGRIFKDNSIPPANPKGICVDSKRRKKLQAKRMAIGHKADDHEQMIR